jgi:acyl-ACP thioesterase
MVDRPAAGRIFTMDMRPLLGDCSPSGRIRLDALARWIQDAAYADIEDAGLLREAIWVVRRTRIKVARFPRFSEPVQVETFASGIGRMWAERRTTVRALPAGGGPLATPNASPPLVEAVTLWIHLDPERRLPSPLNQHEVSVYAEAAGDRRFPHRLTHPRPGPGLEQCEWVFRRCDSDLADHVNNAAYWEALEEELLACAGELTEIDVELEFRAPAQPGRVRLVRDGPYRWLMDPDSDEVYASMLVTNARTTSGSN